jgi:hypothetical protein
MSNKSKIQIGNHRKAGNPQSKQNKNNNNSGKVTNSQLNGVGKMSYAPVAKSRMVRSSRPNIQSMRNGDCRIVHREYIQDVVANATGPPTTFSVATISINPGIQATFPWLSKIAQNFESYRFRKLNFCYETEAPSSLGGTLVLAVDYDAIDNVPLSKQQALAYRSSVRSAPWTECCHKSVSEDLHKLKSNYVRSGALPAGTDLKTYDVGNLFVVTQGVTTSSAVCGELYVEYDLDLLTPLYEPVFQTGSSVNASGAGSTTTNLLGTSAVAAGSIGISHVNNVLTLTNLVVGSDFSLSIGLSGVSISGTLAAAATSGCTAGAAFAPTVVTQTADSALFTYIATATTAVVTLSGITLFTTPANAAVIVSMNASNGGIV